MNSSETYQDKKLSKLSPQEAVMAVEKGIKPIAFLKEKVETSLPCLEFETTMISGDEKDTITRIFKEKNYVYYGVGQELNVERIRELVVQMTDEQLGNLKVGDTYINKPPSDEYHRELGELLGYSDEEIKEFIEKIHS